MQRLPQIFQRCAARHIRFDDMIVGDVFESSARFDPFVVISHYYVFTNIGMVSLLERYDGTANMSRYDLFCSVSCFLRILRTRKSENNYIDMTPQSPH